MLIHVTRHGQPARHRSETGDPEYPRGDPPLTELGHEQARLLGRHLAKNGFGGPIFSSPYRRTLETAAAIAHETNCSIFPTRELQEWVPGEGVPDFGGLELEDMRSLFGCIAPDAALPHPWFYAGPEDIAAVQARARPFIESLGRTLKGHTADEALLVGHGASTGACINELLLKDLAPEVNEDPDKNWNCSLSTVEIGPNDTRKLKAHFSIDHFPAEIVTSNQLRYVGSE